MSINVIGKLKPQNNGSFPVVEDIDIQGGLQVRNNLTDRDSIPALTRKAGMLVYCRSDLTYYQLGAGLTNADWTEAVFSAGGGPDGVFKIDPISPTSNIGTVSPLQLAGDRGLTAGAVIPGGSFDTAYFIGAHGLVSVPLDTNFPTFHFISDSLTATGVFNEMIYADGALWALSYTADSAATPSTPSTLLHINPTTFATTLIHGLTTVTRTGATAVKSSMAFEPSTSTIWIINDTGFTRVSTGSNTTDGAVTVLSGGGSPSAITAGGGYIWIGTTGGVLYKIDPNTLVQTNTSVTLTAGDNPFFDELFYVPSVSNGDKLVAYRTKAALPAVMFRIDAATLSHLPASDFYFSSSDSIFVKAHLVGDSLIFVDATKA
jgi:hypothetical protein